MRIALLSAGLMFPKCLRASLSDICHRALTVTNSSSTMSKKRATITARSLYAAVCFSGRGSENSAFRLTNIDAIWAENMSSMRSELIPCSSRSSCMSYSIACTLKTTSVTDVLNSSIVLWVTASTSCTTTPARRATSSPTTLANPTTVLLTSLFNSTTFTLTTLVNSSTFFSVSLADRQKSNPLKFRRRERETATQIKLTETKNCVASKIEYILWTRSTYMKTSHLKTRGGR